jgi:uncharacterized protein (TIGR02646 family)
MRRIERPPKPHALAKNETRWKDAWVAKIERTLETDKAAVWNWPHLDKIPLNQLLWPLLEEMTQSHCAYCDGPFAESRKTIDHFRPKVKQPQFAYDWSNLFVACDRCQTRGEEWSEDLLKPDAEDYQFSDYFICDIQSGKVVTNPSVDAEKQKRAKKTIELFDLNNTARTKARSRELKHFTISSKNEETANIDDYNYRFFIEAVQ